MDDFAELGIWPELLPGITKSNAAAVLGLGPELPGRHNAARP